MLSTIFLRKNLLSQKIPKKIYTGFPNEIINELRKSIFLFLPMQKKREKNWHQSKNLRDILGAITRAFIGSSITSPEGLLFRQFQTNQKSIHFHYIYKFLFSLMDKRSGQRAYQRLKKRRQKYRLKNIKEYVLFTFLFFHSDKRIHDILIMGRGKKILLLKKKQQIASFLKNNFLNERNIILELWGNSFQILFTVRQLKFLFSAFLDVRLHYDGNK